MNYALQKLRADFDSFAASSRAEISVLTVEVRKLARELAVALEHRIYEADRPPFPKVPFPRALRLIGIKPPRKQH